MQLMPIDNLPHHLKIIVYGKPDAGKTTLACSGASHPQFSPTALIDFEGGLESVRWAGNGLMRTPRIKTVDQIDEVIVAAASRQGSFETVKCIVLDSLTKMAKVILGEIVAKKHAARPRKGGLDEIQISDYGDLSKAMERYIDMLVNLDMHVVLISLEKDVKDDTDAVIEQTLGLPGALPDKMIAACDNVFALRKLPARAATDEEPAKDPEVVMFTQQCGSQFARTRSVQFREALGGAMMNPTLPKIWEKYQASMSSGQESLKG